MTLTSVQPAKLVGVSSPAAGVVEVHEMKMENDMMRMRQMPALDLPAGQLVKLAPAATT
jgi:copper(I)-binding protein